MSVLFTQHWDVEPKKETDYSNFIMSTYNVAMEKMGLSLVGGYYVAVGMGPRIIGVAAADSLHALDSAIGTEEYQELTSRLMEYVKNYHSKVLVPTGRVTMKDYRIQTGIWKFNQYWNIIPGMEKDYAAFVKSDYLPALEQIGVPVTGGWRVVIGSGPYIVSESSAPNIVDIAKAIEADEFRRVMRTLKSTYVTDYHSRILAPTGRIDIPYFMKELMKGF